MELRLNVSIRFLKYALAWETGSAFARLACVRRVNKTPPSNVCQTAPISLFWASRGLMSTILPQMSFEFPFKLTGRLTIFFFCNRPIMALAQILVPRWGPQFRHCFADGLNQKFSGLFHDVQRIIIYSLSFFLLFFIFRKYAEAKACVKNATLTLCKMTGEQVEVVNFYCDTFNPFCFNLSDPPMVKQPRVSEHRVSRESGTQLPAVTPTQSVKGSAEVKSRGGGQSTSLSSYRFVVILSVVVLIRTVS